MMRVGWSGSALPFRFAESFGPPAGSHARSMFIEAIHRYRKKKAMMTLLYIVLGAAAGLAYQRFIGCRSGTCAITSNPYVSTMYGALMGYMLSGGFR